jgi:hypothetical protein
MANVSRINGFTPVQLTFGGPVTGRVNKYVATDSNSMFVGDIVKLDGSTGAGAEAGYRGVTKITATTDVPCGVVVGFAPLVTNLNLPSSYKAADATDRVVYVCDDPDALFEAHAGSGIAAAGVGLNVSVDVTAGSTTTGISGMFVDDGTEATTDSLIARIVGFKDTPDNELAAAGQRVLVKFNRHSYRVDVAASAGV